MAYMPNVDLDFYIMEMSINKFKYRPYENTVTKINNKLSRKLNVFSLDHRDQSITIHRSTSYMI